MTQNLIDLEFSGQQLRDTDAALSVLVANRFGLIALKSSQRQKLYRMGVASKPSCRHAVLVTPQNPPPSGRSA